MHPGGSPFHFSYRDVGAFISASKAETHKVSGFGQGSDSDE